jgi:hypothetical protein
VRLTVWNILYIGAVLCALLAGATIYQITVTRDVSEEWKIWIYVILGFSLFGLGFLLEGRYKRDHPDEAGFRSPLQP